MEKGRLWKLFSSTFMLSAFTFGGGYVIVTLMKERFVDRYHWIEEEEMLDMTAIAQSAPGPIAVNGAIVVGYKLAKIPGALSELVSMVSDKQVDFLAYLLPMSSNVTNKISFLIR